MARLFRKNTSLLPYGDSPRFLEVLAVFGHPKRGIDPSPL
jgi:hypothetical protein